MDFFGIGPWEIVLILVLSLIILGPGKITETARTLGKIVRSIRKTSAEFTTAVTREMNKIEEDEQPKPPPKSEKPAPSPADEIQKALEAEKPSPDTEKPSPTDHERQPQ